MIRELENLKRESFENYKKEEEVKEMTNVRKNKMIVTKNQKGEVEKMERKTWKEYLEGCDVSGWKWSFLDRLDIVDETEDEYIVRLSLADITDDPYLEIEETENGETMINWGGNDWVVITDYDENHEIFIKIDKTRDPADNCFHSSDGNIYVDEYEK